MSDENRVFDESMIRKAMRPSDSPIVEILTGDDKPLTNSTITMARHADGTFTVLAVDIKP